MRFVFQSHALERAGLTFAGTVAAYYLGGAIGGVLVGLLWPLTRSMLGAGLVGYLGGFPFFLNLALMSGAAGQGRGIFWGSVLGSSLLGAALGVWIWRDNERDPSMWST
jgi:hypothetical protein